MKILYIVARAIEINTSSSIRNKATINGLIENGHEVTLLTPKPDKNHENFDGTMEQRKGLDVHYIELKGKESLVKLLRRFNVLKPIKEKLYEYYNNKNIYDSSKEIVNYIEEIPFRMKGYDLVISSSDPKSSHLFVLKLLEKNKLENIKWLQIWGDPFAADITNSNKKEVNIIKKEEERLLALADKVMYVSKFTFEEQQQLYPPYSEKMFWLPVPYTTEKIYSNSILTKESLTFLYAGDYFTSVRNILPLYKAFIGSKHKLIICGATDITLDEKENITILPRISQQEVSSLTRKSDVLVHLSNKKRHQIPGKVYHYSGTNKPILFILDGNEEKLYDYFSKFNRFVFSSNDVNSLIKKLNNFKNNLSEVTNEPLLDFKSKNIAKKIVSMTMKN